MEDLRFDSAVNERAALRRGKSYVYWLESV
jgi:hypothetical protein